MYINPQELKKSRADEEGVIDLERTAAADFWSPGSNCSERIVLLCSHWRFSMMECGLLKKPVIRHFPCGKSRL
jgi:hypothetical protein